MRNILAIILFAASISEAQDFDAVQIKTTKLTETIYMLEGAATAGIIGVCVGEEERSLLMINLLH